MKHQSDLLAYFVRHKVAANLLMIMMLLGGLFALHKLTIRYFPQFDLDYITVQVDWRGASPEDVETAITTPLEQHLKSVDHLRKITSTSSQGTAFIKLELMEGTDTIHALNQVNQKVDEFRNLPVDAEKPVVINLERYEQIARIVLYGPNNPADLRIIANNFEQQLLDQGIDKVDVNGLPEQEIAIQIPHDRLQHLHLSLNQIAQRINQLSQDIPAGSFGENEVDTELRILNQRRTVTGFASLPVISDQTTLIKLGDFAVIKRQNKKGGVTLTVENKPAVEMVLRNSDSGDSLKAARILRNWLQQTRAVLPPHINLYVYDESWKLIKDRITLLLKNGGSGLILVIAILYLFLSSRVALWIAVGIPVSFMATLLFLYAVGGSINMISLFALIMALGVIVDDAIVVGEDALSHYQRGEPASAAAEGGVRRMHAPVIASSLTTIAAFIPLMIVGGPTGKILFDIPLVIVVVIMASILESFFVLPSHLHHSFQHMNRNEPTGWRLRFNDHFDNFKNIYFKRLISLTLHYRAVALSLVVALLIVALGLLAGHRLKFHFFPSPESSILYVNIGFVPGTPKNQVDNFLQQLQQSLAKTESELSQQPLVLKVISRQGSDISNKGKAEHSGDHLASMTIELQESDKRSVRNSQLIKVWKQHIHKPAGLDIFTISSRLVGPPGRELTVRLTGNTAKKLKQAALELSDTLQSIPGISDIEDDMPYGRNQRVYTLTSTGLALGLTTEELGRQLRTAFDGKLVQLFQDGLDEVEVRVELPDNQRQNLNAPEQLEIRLANGDSVPLDNVATWHSRRGFEILRHAQGKLAVEVSAAVDSKVNNTNLIVDALQKKVMPQLASHYGIHYSFEGRSADQAETMADMRYGLIMGLLLIYLVLAWVFASYGWPLVVMAAIPFGLIGALFGHLLMGIDLTILSLFGLFGLSGIVINDSIILASFYKHLIHQGLSKHDALVEASCQRLRAVLLTSLTTIAGLAPLLLETSLQAQFLIPMATAIAFGLLFSTVLVLLIIPVLLSYHDDIQDFFTGNER